MRLAPFSGLEEIFYFFDWQKTQWPQFANAIKGLEDVETKILGPDLKTQFNPARTQSSQAIVTKDAIKLRPCFLCPINQPVEEYALPVTKQLLAQANPAPILQNHFVLTHKEHRPQEILPVLEDAILITFETGLDVFYNGPSCGASAPDHLHLQAVKSGFLPDLVFNTSAHGITTTNRAISIIERHDKLLSVLKPILEKTGNNINVLFSKIDSYVKVLIYLRKKHRPQCYFTGEMLISPGAIDMAGLLITTRNIDFKSLNYTIAKSILEEVTIPPTHFLENQCLNLS